MTRHAAYTPTKLRPVIVLALAGLFLAGLLTILLAGRPLAFAVVKEMTARKFPDVRWIGTEDYGRWRADSTQVQPLILDARTEAEFEVSHLQGAQRIDPYYPNILKLSSLPKDTPIVVYCSVGYRSARVAERLARAGFVDVFNLDGSIFRWANEGRVVVAGGVPTTLVHPYDGRWGRLLQAKYRADAALADIEKRSAAP